MDFPPAKKLRGKITLIRKKATLLDGTYTIYILKKETEMLPLFIA